jgi:hypothetical protein
MTTMMTRTARQGRPSRLANGPLMARTSAIVMDDQGPASESTAWSWAFLTERVRGIEPPLSAWEADVLPLNYTRATRRAV